MKTVVFYSYKGGVGRTLAMANFAKALMKLGKSVTVLDLDLDSPGLHHRLVDTMDSEQRGYVNYLSDRLGTAWNYAGVFPPIKEYCVSLDSGGKSFMIPAGNPATLAYWQTLGSDAVLRAANPSLIDGNRQAINTIKEAIRTECKPDYFLVDCRAGNERAAAALLLWADVIVAMFASHREGIQGTAFVHKRVSFNSGDDKIVFIPVICRAPESMSQDVLRHSVAKEYSDCWNSTTIRPLDARQPGKPPEAGDFAVLHECRPLEASDRLLLDGASGSDDLRLVLTHDYIELFERVTPEIRQELASLEGERTWRSEMGLSAQAELLEKYFTLNIHGELTNADKERNVALRVETLRHMMDTIYLSVRDGVAGARADGMPCPADISVREAFHQAGRAAGRSFGAEMMQTRKVWPSGPPRRFEDRVRGWCAFDSEVGFGAMAAELDDNGGRISLTRNFLTYGREGGTPDLNPFLQGYMEGVLSHLVDGVSGKAVSVHVTIVDSETFRFTVDNAQVEGR